MVTMVPPPVASAMPHCLHLLLALAVSAGIAFGLRLKAVQVPTSVTAGSVVVLACLFDPEQELLYSVKWYKDEFEFFRHLPNDNPPNQCFEIPDFEVDMSRSSKGTVYLKNTSISAEGTYKCEVSADAPSFRSISMEKFMAVEDRPPVVNLSSLGPIASWLLLLLLFLCH